MINLIMQGRDLAVEIIENSISWFVRQRSILRRFPLDIYGLGTSGRPICELGDRVSLMTSTRVPYSFLRGHASMPNQQTLSDMHELAESTPRSSGFLVGWVSWLRGDGRGTRRMLDTKIPVKDALEMMLVPIVAIDHRRRITFANTETMKLFGYTREELAGASVELLFPIYAVRDNHLTGKESVGENRLADMSRKRVLIARRHDGVAFSTEVSTTNYGGADQILQITAMPGRNACGEFDRSHEELEHLARVSSLGELAGSLAHELKQPLTAILFNAQAAQRFMESETVNIAELRDALGDIITDNCRANEVIQKIRTLVRKGVIELRPLDIGEVVRDVALLVRSDAIARGVRTSFDIADNLAMVCGDKVQLQQVVLNLLLNAFDALKERAPAQRMVEVTVREEPDDGVRITVKDWGVGLTVDKMHKIFRAFFTTKPQGLGLGLSISRTIITGHGGRIWAENNDGMGASFHITLPRGTTLRQDSGPKSP
jgi:two-component system, LuxR family, sensor kinase FixL